MVLQETPTLPHWNYFLAVERDLATQSRYVEFDTRNFKCFSIELARMIMAAGAEADVVCKQICVKLDSNSKADGINNYRDEINPAFPGISNFKVLIPRFGLSLHPWEKWHSPGGVPSWWTAYNKVKHHRDSHYHQANLKNALNAIAGLFVVVLYLYKEEAESGKLKPGEQILWPGAANTKGSVTAVRPLYRL